MSKDLRSLDSSIPLTEHSLYITTNASSILSESQTSLIARLHANGNEYTITGSITGVRKSSPANLGTTTSDEDDYNSTSDESSAPIVFSSTPNLQRLISIRSTAETAVRSQSFPADNIPAPVSELYELAQGTVLEDITEVDSDGFNSVRSRRSMVQKSSNPSMKKKTSGGSIASRWKPANLRFFETTTDDITTPGNDTSTSSSPEMRIKPSAERLGTATVVSENSSHHSIFKNISRLMQPSKASLADGATTENPQSTSGGGNTLLGSEKGQFPDTITSRSPRSSLRERLSRFFARADTLFELGSADGRSTSKSQSKYDGIDDSDRGVQTKGGENDTREDGIQGNHEGVAQLGGQVVE